MATVTVQADVDLDEFSTRELVTEICERLTISGGRKALSDNEKKELKKAIIELNKTMKMPLDDAISIKTLDDQMKYEYLSKVFTKYSCAEIEKLLPE